jgi:hypothetical protein
MALSSYTDLLNAAAQWLKRDDLGAILPDLLVLAESRLARDIRFRVQSKQATISFLAGINTTPLPADFVEFLSVSHQDRGDRLDAMPVPQIRALYTPAMTGRPRVYAQIEESILVAPTPGSVTSLDVVYRSRFPALSPTNATNWLLQNHPSLYLFALLAEASPFTHEDERAAIWEAKYKAELETARRDDDYSRYGSGDLTIRSL